MTLIITNGDVVARTLRSAGLDGTIIPWRDTLVDGPVPFTADLATLDQVRAGFLSDAFAVPLHEIEEDFAQRRQQLDHLAPESRVELWFEHDLFDQLQLFQALDALNRHGRPREVFLVQADDYLGRHDAGEILRFADCKRVLDAMDFEIASQVWNAYCATTPEAWVALIADPDLIRFPFLPAAMVRAVDELPSSFNGLTRTEARILAALSEGHDTPSALFIDNQRREPAIFLGDWSFWRRLEDLAFATEPLIDGLPERFSEIYRANSSWSGEGLAAELSPDPGRIEAYTLAHLALTAVGRAVLHGTVDHVALNGIDRWWGGTHLTEGRCWRWDHDAQALRSPLEHFRAKWIPVRVKKMRPSKDLEQFQEKCEAVFRLELRKNRDLERIRDSEKSGNALGNA